MKAIFLINTQQLKIHKVHQDCSFMWWKIYIFWMMFGWSKKKTKRNEGSAEKRSSVWQCLLPFCLNNFFFSVESILSSFPYFRSEGYSQLSTDAQSRESPMHGSQGRTVRGVSYGSRLRLSPIMMGSVYPLWVPFTVQSFYWGKWGDVASAVTCIRTTSYFCLRAHELHKKYILIPFYI